MTNPNIQIYDLIESKMNEIILTINQTYSIFEADKLHGELRILDWIFYQVCINKKWKSLGHRILKKHSKLTYKALLIDEVLNKLEAL